VKQANLLLEIRFTGLEYRQILRAYDFVRATFKEELASRDIKYNRLEVFFSKFRIVLWLQVGSDIHRAPNKAILSRAVLALCQRFSLGIPATWGKAEGLLTILDDELLPMTVGDLVAGDITMAGKIEIPVRSTQHYWREMTRNKVFLDNDQREKHIRQLLHEAASNAGGEIITSPIINEVVLNCEQPVSGIVDISLKHRDIPKVLTLIVMEKMQFFALHKGDQLLPKAVFVCNEGCQPREELNAALDQAREDYFEDLHHTISQLQLQLQSLCYLSKLGSFYDKEQRLQKIVLSMAKLTDAGQEVCDIAGQASQIAKLDVTTATCRAYPEFLGHMGADIARAAGAPEMVASAIIEHWHPSKFSGKLPHTLVGALLGVADRLDSICGQYYQNELKLSQYRSVKKWFDEIIAIIASVPLDISIINLLKFSLSLYESQGLVPWRTQDLDSLLKIFSDCLYYYLQEQDFSEGVAAVLTDLSQDNVFVVTEKAKAMEDPAMKDFVEDCAEICKLMDRVCSREYNYEEATLEFLEEPEELDLFEVYLVVRDEIRTYLHERKTPEALRSLARLKTPLLRFINNVDLDTDDRPLRYNRMSLLGEIRQLYLTYGDFSAL
jgi:glycyl-tRNA synthetase beta chain